MGLKMKIACVILGILAEVAITWYNTYGETEIWSRNHFLRIILIAAIFSFFIEIVKSAKLLLIAAYLSSGVVLAILGSLIFKMAEQNAFNRSGLINAALYVLSVFVASLVGAFLGRLALKDKYK